MERLTLVPNDGSDAGLRGYCTEQDAINRLAAYEDTGLTPAQIKYILPKQSAEEAVERMKDEKERYDEWFSWKQAEQEGRLLVLPCKPMTTVYVIEHVDCYMDSEACPLLDESGRCSGEGEMPCPLHIVEVVADIDSLAKWIVLNAFNNTVFLTHEAAEVALEEREDA